VAKEIDQSLHVLESDAAARSDVLDTPDDFARCQVDVIAQLDDERPARGETRAVGRNS
jgi:hypothetical protein